MEILTDQRTSHPRSRNPISLSFSLWIGDETRAFSVEREIKTLLARALKEKLKELLQMEGT